MRKQSTSQRARTEAKALGQAQYQGKPCRHGHDGMRYTRNTSCVECRRTAALLRYANNPLRGSEQGKRWRTNNPERTLWLSAKHRALRNGREFDIDVSDIVIPEICPALQVPISVPTLDRKDTSKGYVKGNIFVIDDRANRIKSDATIEELEKILDYMRS